MNTRLSPPATKQQQMLTASYTLPATLTGADMPNLISDAVLPEQFYGPPRGAARNCGQVALMRAVLTDAIECYQQQCIADGRRVQRLAKEAEAWLFDDDERWPFAFVNVCAALGMEPEYVRRGLRRTRHHSSATAKQKLRHAAPVRRIPRIAA